MNGYRMDDAKLLQFLKDATGDIERRMEYGVYTIETDRLVLMELVKRELDRRDSEKGGMLEKVLKGLACHFIRK